MRRTSLYFELLNNFASKASEGFSINSSSCGKIRSATRNQARAGLAIFIDTIKAHCGRQSCYFNLHLSVSSNVLVKTNLSYNLTRCESRPIQYEDKKRLIYAIVTLNSSHQASSQICTFSKFKISIPR